MESTHRVAVLDEELCQPKKCGLECIIYCPVNKTGGECIIQRPEDGKAVISEDLCTGCGICVKKCPFDAIIIVNLAKELSEHKIHQYGINSFRLYRLPAPKKGSVVGLLGRNSMGKSTIINILSGFLKPNFGNYEVEVTWDQVLKNFQGTELKSYFDKIANGTIRASIKPQLVYLIPKAFKGTANELLKKYDERKETGKLVDELGLANILDRKVSQDLAKEGKSVMVVEHDMTLLDYLSDYIHILYGESGAYGIVSSLQGTKLGINNFLEGFLPIENIRFREKAFRFDTTSSIDDMILDVPMARYSDITKSFLS